MVTWTGHTLRTPSITHSLFNWCTPEALSMISNDTTTFVTSSLQLLAWKDCICESIFQQAWNLLTTWSRKKISTRQKAWPFILMTDQTLPWQQFKEKFLWLKRNRGLKCEAITSWYLQNTTNSNSWALIVKHGTVTTVYNRRPSQLLPRHFPRRPARRPASDLQSLAALEALGAALA